MAKPEKSAAKIFGKAVDKLFAEHGKGDAEAGGNIYDLGNCTMLDGMVGPNRAATIALGENAGSIIIRASVSLGIFGVPNSNDQGFHDHTVHFNPGGDRLDGTVADVVVKDDTLAVNYYSDDESLSEHVGPEVATQIAEWLGGATLAPEVKA